MRDSWRPYLQIRAPRYTSYPSALRFNDGVDAGAFADKLAGIGPYEPVSLYVHVPFCRRMCWYCGCTMRVENNYARVRRYVDALCEEIRAVGDVLSGRGRPIGVHFGGGTPNILHNEDLARVLQAVEESIGLTDDARLAIELDPRLLENGDAAALRTLGFTRISLGVQDFDRHVQEAINRVQSFELVEACVSDMRVAGVDDLSIDILYGLPKQTERTFLRTLDKVVALSPDRVSVFGYAHLPSVLANQRMIVDADLPDDALRGELAEMADGALLR
ncbi:MAG: radical SAM protein, partial [Pseudomonadota bacterium]